MESVAVTLLELPVAIFAEIVVWPAARNDALPFELPIVAVAVELLVH